MVVSALESREVVMGEVMDEGGATGTEGVAIVVIEHPRPVSALGAECRGWKSESIPQHPGTPTDRF